MNNILIIGGCGYIGSRLYEVLSHDANVDTIDLEWYGNFINDKNKKSDCAQVKKEDIEKYSHIVMLAGHSSVKMCEENMISTIDNNVLNFAKVLDLITNEQVFIYASSSSVYGDTESACVDEEYTHFKPNNYYDLSKHEIDSYAELSNKTYFGLRFGTVNGYSPNLRNDVMINAMTFNAVENGKIFCFNPEVNRPILGMSDLCRAIKTIVENGNSKNKGIYNLASFNSTVREISKSVSSVTKAELEIVDKPPEHITNVKLQAKSYDFLIKTDKFETEFNFTFEETVESIVKSLLDNYENMQKGNRSSAKLYGN